MEPLHPSNEASFNPHLMIWPIVAIIVIFVALASLIMRRSKHAFKVEPMPTVKISSKLKDDLTNETIE